MLCGVSNVANESVAVVDLRLAVAEGLLPTLRERRTDKTLALAAARKLLHGERSRVELTVEEAIAGITALLAADPTDEMGEKVESDEHTPAIETKRRKRKVNPDHRAVPTDESGRSDAAMRQQSGTGVIVESQPSQNFDLPAEVAKHRKKRRKKKADDKETKMEKLTEGGGDIYAGATAGAAVAANAAADTDADADDLLGSVTSPPNLRLATDWERCGNCVFFHKGCNLYGVGRPPVDSIDRGMFPTTEDQTCDSQRTLTPKENRDFTAFSGAQQQLAIAESSRDTAGIVSARARLDVLDARLEEAWSKEARAASMLARRGHHQSYVYGHPVGTSVIHDGKEHVIEKSNQKTTQKSVTLKPKDGGPSVEVDPGTVISHVSKTSVGHAQGDLVQHRHDGAQGKVQGPEKDGRVPVRFHTGDRDPNHSFQIKSDDLESLEDPSRPKKLAEALVDLIEVSSSVYPSLDRSPKKNWVDKAGGLPKYIERIAKHLHYEKGKDIGHSIAIAVNVVKRMCAAGDTNFPGKQNVNPKSRAEACAAVAEWEAKKAKTHAKNAVSENDWVDLVPESGLEIAEAVYEHWEPEGVYEKALRRVEETFKPIPPSWNFIEKLHSDIALIEGTREWMEGFALDVEEEIEAEEGVFDSLKHPRGRSARFRSVLARMDKELKGRGGGDAEPAPKRRPTVTPGMRNDSVGGAFERGQADAVKKAAELGHPDKVAAFIKTRDSMFPMMSKDDPYTRGFSAQIVKHAPGAAHKEKEWKPRMNVAPDYKIGEGGPLKMAFEPGPGGYDAHVLTDKDEMVVARGPRGEIGRMWANHEHAMRKAGTGKFAAELLGLLGLDGPSLAGQSKPPVGGDSFHIGGGLRLSKDAHEQLMGQAKEVGNEAAVSGFVEKLKPHYGADWDSIHNNLKLHLQKHQRAALRKPPNRSDWDEVSRRSGSSARANAEHDRLKEDVEEGTFNSILHPRDRRERFRDVLGRLDHELKSGPRSFSSAGAGKSVLSGTAASAGQRKPPLSRLAQQKPSGDAEMDDLSVDNAVGSVLAAFQGVKDWHIEPMSHDMHGKPFWTVHIDHAQGHSVAHVHGDGTVTDAGVPEVGHIPLTGVTAPADTQSNHDIVHEHIKKMEHETHPQYPPVYEGLGMQHMAWEQGVIPGHKVDVRWTNSGSAFGAHATVVKKNKASINVVLDHDVDGYKKGQKIQVPLMFAEGMSKTTFSQNNGVFPAGSTKGIVEPTAPGEPSSADYLKWMGAMAAKGMSPSYSTAENHDAVYPALTHFEKNPSAMNGADEDTLRFIRDIAEDVNMHALSAKADQILKAGPASSPKPVVLPLASGGYNASDYEHTGDYNVASHMTPGTIYKGTGGHFMHMGDAWKGKVKGYTAKDLKKGTTKFVPYFAVHGHDYEIHQLKGSGPISTPGQAVSSADKVFADLMDSVKGNKGTIDSVAGKNFVVTGTIPGYKRDDVHDMISAAGGSWQKSVTNATHVLVTGGAVGQNKIKAAAAKGVTVIPWEDFKHLIESALGPDALKLAHTNSLLTEALDTAEIVRLQARKAVLTARLGLDPLARFGLEIREYGRAT